MGHERILRAKLRASQPPPPHSRIFSLDDVVALTAIARLLQLDVSHRRLRTVIPAIREKLADSASDWRLYVVAGEVFFEQEPAICAAKGTDGRSADDVITIDSASLVKEVKRQVERLGERTPDQIGRVTHDRYVMNGDPIIAGTRIPIVTIVDFARQGLTPAEIVASYPRLTEEDVAAAVAYEAGQRDRAPGLKRVSA